MTQNSIPNTLERVSVVLVEPSHPGNIGAAARAMKTMGLTDLRLVNPVHKPNEEAYVRASGADDVLANARIVSSLGEALSGCTHVLGTTSRFRRLSCPIVPPREGVSWATRTQAGERAALVFGRERTGLDNEEVQYCHRLVRIDANPEYASLNLAAAVQLLCYEFRVAALGQGSPVETDAPHAPAEDVEAFYAHLQRVMIRTGFLNPEKPRYLMTRVRRLFARAEPEVNEVNILRGILTSVEKELDRDSPGT